MPHFCLSSALEPMTSISPQSGQTQTGRGVPQYLSRERPQSITFSRKLPILPSFMVSGIQFTERLAAIMSSFTFVTSINHDERA